MPICRIENFCGSYGRKKKVLARTQNMSALARDTGLNRGNLYEALSEDGNPTLATLLKVTRALGLRLSLEPVEDGARGAQTL